MGQISILRGEGLLESYESANGSLLTASLVPKFYISNEYNLSDQFWDDGLSVNGSVNFQQFFTRADLATTNNTISKAINQQLWYNRYIPGFPHEIQLTAAVDNLEQGDVMRWGLFDNNNGWIWGVQRKAGGDFEYFLTQRKTFAAGGSPDDSDTVLQENWNIDTLDGSGGPNNPSGIKLNPDARNLYKIRPLWLGVGPSVFGVESSDKKFVPCHIFKNENIVGEKDVYMRTPHLPARYEVDNNGVAKATPSVLRQICTLIAGAGGLDPFAEQGYPFGDFSETQTISSNVNFRPLISVRLKTTFKGLPNRALVFPKSYSVITDSGNNSLQVALFKDANLSGASWQSPNNDSCCEFDKSATSLTGGRLINADIVAPRENGKGLDLGRTILTLNAAGTESKILTLAVREQFGNTDCIGSLNVEEKW